MSKEKKEANHPDIVWKEFIQTEHVSIEQSLQFKQYLELLLLWNEQFNLTRIVQESSIIRLHFQDSLYLGHCMDMKHIIMIADIGTGAGFPGIPLKIRYPHLTLVLIEVSHKKRIFLEKVIHALALKNIEVCAYDWRTFLRKTAYPINLFVTRAALSTSELMRMFKPSCIYKKARMVYWASQQWSADEKIVPFIEREYRYTLHKRKRKLVVFSHSVT